MIREDRTTLSQEEKDRALGALSTAHAVALRMRDRGASDAAIAEALGIPVESVPKLLDVAERKLQAELRRDRRGED